jgi:two-component system sensor histidine kinase DctS
VVAAPLDLPGAPMVLRLEGARQLPDVFPNVLTALVTGLSIALVTVLVLLARDFPPPPAGRGRAGRGAGLSQGDGGFARHRPARARPAGPHHLRQPGLLRHGGLRAARADRPVGVPAPYWPPERAHEYGQRQALRLAGQAPAREGVESVFMRKDGTRFPVLIFEAPLISTRASTPAGWARCWT